MKFFKIAAVAAIAFSSAAFSAHAATVDGIIEGSGSRVSDGVISLGSTISFSPNLMTFATDGEFAGYSLTSLDALKLETGDANDGQILTAQNGADTITFTVSDTIVAAINTNGVGSAPGWNLSGLLSVSGASGLLSSVASFSLAGTNVSGVGYSFYIQTPPVDLTAPVPLPAGALLLLGALVGLGALRRKV